MKHIHLFVLTFMMHSLGAVDAEQTAKQVIRHLNSHYAHHAKECVTKFIAENRYNREDLHILKNKLACSYPPKAWTWSLTGAYIAMALAGLTCVRLEKELNESNDVPDYGRFAWRFSGVACMLGCINIILNTPDYRQIHKEFDITKRQLLAQIDNALQA